MQEPPKHALKRKQRAGAVVAPAPAKTAATGDSKADKKHKKKLRAPAE